MQESPNGANSNRRGSSVVARQNYYCKVMYRAEFKNLDFNNIQFTYGYNNFDKNQLVKN